MHTSYNNHSFGQRSSPFIGKYVLLFCGGVLLSGGHISGRYTENPLWLTPQYSELQPKVFPKPGWIFWEYLLHAIRKGYWEQLNSRGELERTVYFDVVFSPLQEPAAWREYRVGREGRLVHTGSYNFGIFAYSDNEITVDRTEETLHKLERRDTWPTPAGVAGVQSHQLTVTDQE